LQFVMDRPAMLSPANVGLPAIHRCDHRTADEHGFRYRQPESLAAAGRYEAAGMLVEPAHFAKIQWSGDHIDGSVARIFAIDFANDLLDPVMRVGKRFYDQSNIFPALEFLAKSAHQNVGRLARKTGRDVQEVKRISTSPVHRLRRLGNDVIGPVA